MSGTGSWGYGTLLQTFIWGYLIGGLTLLPAVAVFAWYWATTPTDTKLLEEPPNNLAGQERRGKSDESVKEGKDAYIKSLGVGLDEQILESLKGRNHEADVFAGYFAVCREYVPGGVNGKPPANHQKEIIRDCYQWTDRPKWKSTDQSHSIRTEY